MMLPFYEMRLQKFGIKCIKRYSFPKLIWCRGIRHILTTFVGEKNNEEQRVLIPRVFFKAQLGEKQVGSLFFYSSNQQQITSL